MRLIDAYALLAQQFKNDISYNAFRSLVKRQATIDAVPVKHGKWIEEDDAIITGTCSVCGWNAIFAETDVSGMPYCPNCGARMDGGG